MLIPTIFPIANSAINFTEEQALLLQSAAEFARKKSPFEAVRRLIETEAGYDPALWSEIVSLGWPGLAVPADFGGSGLSLADAVPIVEAMGRHLLASPLLVTTLAAQVLSVCGTPVQKEKWLPKICAGMIATVALSEPGGEWNYHAPSSRALKQGDKLALFGQKRFIAFAGDAEIVLVSIQVDGAPGFALVERNDIPAAALKREVCIDETQRTFSLTLDGLTIPPGNLLDVRQAAAGLARLVDGATLLLSAEMCGGVAGVLDVTIDYLKTREQFGRLIGAYQALKHPVADIFVNYELSRSLVYGAASAFGSDPQEPLVHMAKAKLSELFVHAGDRAIQFHGGFGFTYDCNAGLYLRRAIWSQSQFGDGPYHRARLAAQMLDKTS